MMFQAVAATECERTCRCASKPRRLAVRERAGLLALAPPRPVEPPHTVYRLSISGSFQQFRR